MVTGTLFFCPEVFECNCGEDSPFEDRLTAGCNRRGHAAWARRRRFYGAAHCKGVFVLKAVG